MWYNGSNGSNGNAVGYATSSDEINWTKHPNNPVLFLGSSGSFDSQWAWSPCGCWMEVFIKCGILVTMEVSTGLAMLPIPHL